MAEYKIFGNTTENTNSNYIFSATSYAKIYPGVPTYTGDVVNITAYVNSATAGQNIWCALYEAFAGSDGGCNALLSYTQPNVNTINATWQWITFPFIKPYRVVAGTKYMMVIAGAGPGGQAVGYVAGSGGTYGFGVAFTGTWPNPLVGEGTQARTSSIYTNYKPSSSLHVDLGASRKLILSAIPTINEQGGKFGGYCGMGKAHVGIPNHPRSRVF
jgi:hypothetical protein